MNMSPAKYPVCSGSDVVKALKNFGYEKVSQRGSHVKMKKSFTAGDHIIVIPLHKVLDRGTLGSIIKRIRVRIGEKEFLAVLRKM